MKKSGQFGDDQDDMAQPQERTPGVYVRENADPYELDMLWAGNKLYQREERSPILFFAGGLILGIVLTSVVFLLINARPNIEFGGADQLMEPVVEEVQSAMPLEGSAAEGGQDSSPVGAQTYTVRDGDTLGGIAYRHYGSSAPEYVDKIRRANNIQGEMIRIGQSLVIPPKNY